MKNVNSGAEVLKLIRERIAKDECIFCGKPITESAVEFLDKNISEGPIKICNSHHISSKPQ